MSTTRFMSRASAIALVSIAFAACNQPVSGGQSSAAIGPRVQPNIYEIAPEQLSTYRQVADAEQSFIEVSGDGSVMVPPDRATVSFAVESREGTAAEATRSNADVMDRVLTTLRDADLPGLELTTFGYSLQPVYAPAGDGRTREIVAYMALNNVRATITDVTQVGRVIDSATGAGTNRVGSISFRASDTSEARSEALTQAVRNARAQAETIAAALGYELGPPLEVRGGAARPSPRVMSSPAVMALERQAAPTPIEAGDQTVTASVTIRFSLGPELGG